MGTCIVTVGTTVITCGGGIITGTTAITDTMATMGIMATGMDMVTATATVIIEGWASGTA